MASDPQGKKWQLTWNNPQSYGLTRDAILEILSQLPLEYFCLCDEIATTGTPHTHAFLYAHSNMRFSTIQRKFPYRTGAGDGKAEPGLHCQRGQVGGHRESGNLCGRQFL